MRRFRTFAVGLALMAGSVVAVDQPALARPSPPTIDLALTGSAAADTSAADHGAALAIDGNAATTWCPSGNSGVLTVDLARAHRLSGFGLTLLGDAASVTVETATAPGRFRTARPAASVRAGSPVWFAAPVTARWVRLSVSGASCVGELRAFGSAPRSMIVGDDLSFAVQERAAGAVYTDGGRVASPEAILAAHPFFHGSLSQLRTNVDDLARRYDRDVAVVETQYGWTLDNGDQLGNFLFQDSQLIPGYPASPEGQEAFISDLLSIVAAVPDHHGAGIFYWQPEWIPGVGWEPGAGTPNDNLTLFDFTGKALPSIDFADPLGTR